MHFDSGVAAVAMDEHDIPELFRMLDTEIATRTVHVQALERTLATLNKAQNLFDGSNIAKVEEVYRRRQEELLAIRSSLEAAKDLFNATVRGLEEQIRSKAEVLQAIDAELGTISKEEDLMQHFAEDQVRLSTGIARVKDALVQQICNTLGPTLFTSGGVGAGGAGAAAGSARR